MENRYTLKIYTPGSSRRFYRVLTFCGSQTMASLCEAILRAIDFDDAHLYEFYMTDRMSRGPSILGPGLDEGGSPFADEVEVDSLNLVKGQKFYLHYDFGDDWIFVISVVKVEHDVPYTVDAVIKAKGALEQYPSYDDE